MTRAKQRGYTFIGLLVSIAILGMMLTMVAQVWSTTERREREAQMLWVGHAYRMAISSYFSMGHQYPLTLEALVVDDRFPVPMHHLRRLYNDPVTGKPDWTLIMSPSGQGIMGVASSSQAHPIKQDGFDTIDETFKDADCYCLWRFVYFANRWNRAMPGSGVVPGVPGSVGPQQPGSPPNFTPGGAGAPGTVNPFSNPTGSFGSGPN